MHSLLRFSLKVNATRMLIHLAHMYAIYQNTIHVIILLHFTNKSPSEIVSITY